ncbi:hypothetical protein Arub01_20440 [Actinomadura rubrobrunea]|uniref:Uncharacterized protein n=1 Tax=Actinomadura rubrobrunea TaxID=115335 RepID=A0A9W6UWL7_9ACTN|nr:hypothetical protein [Actinomadura rubrobrunea]GLW63800.1 hypothetical protein Arub01_20440 [Actinomadura rubrobrunea]
MGELLTLPVPETLRATYVAALPAPTADPRELVRERVARHVAPPLRDLVLGMLDSPLMALDLRSAEDVPPPPARLLAAYGATRADLAALAAASHLLVVHASYRPGWPPAHEWAARAAAGAVGRPVVDVFTPQVLAADLLERSLPDPDGAVRLVDWMLLPHTAGRHGFWFTTRGLARFGLPELQTENVPPPLVETWGRFLNGVARRLLDLWLAALSAGAPPPVVELPEIVSVGLQDVAAAHGERTVLRREVAVRLRLDPVDTGDGEEPVLTVLAADDGPDRLEHLCAALFGSSSPAAGWS